MSELDIGISYILVPFLYRGRKSFDKYIFDKDGDKEWSKDNDFINSLEKNLNCINTVFSRAIALQNKCVEHNFDFVRMCYFETGIGFLILKKVYRDNVNIFTSERSRIDKNDYNTISNSITNNFDQVEFFLNGKVKFSIVMSKAKTSDIYSFISDSTDLWVEKVKNAGEPFTLDKLHKCYSSFLGTCIITEQDYSSITDDERLAEKTFRESIELPLLRVFMLLHHEKQLYLLIREHMIKKDEKTSQIVRRTKTSFITLLTYYSFQMVSDDYEIQSIYSDCRERLGISNLESDISGLIFTLDNELNIRRDKKITLISLVIAVMGLFQLASVLLDVISYFGLNN